jgi:hypothetical protein
MERIEKKLLENIYILSVVIEYLACVLTFLGGCKKIFSKKHGKRIKTQIKQILYTK